MPNQDMKSELLYHVYNLKYWKFCIVANQSGIGNSKRDQKHDIQTIIHSQVDRRIYS